MAELCHVCDLFRTALFGATNTAEDHLDNGEDDLPSPMADAPATLRAPKVSKMGADGSENAAVTGHSHGHSAQAVSMASSQTRQPAPKTNFKKRPTRTLRNAPAYMSFDDVEVADSDSDCEIFMDDQELEQRRRSATIAIPVSQLTAAAAAAAASSAAAASAKKSAASAAEAAAPSTAVAVPSADPVAVPAPVEPEAQEPQVPTPASANPVPPVLQEAPAQPTPAISAGEPKVDVIRAEGQEPANGVSSSYLVGGVAEAVPSPAIEAVGVGGSAARAVGIPGMDSAAMSMDSGTMSTDLLAPPTDQPVTASAGVGEATVPAPISTVPAIVRERSSEMGHSQKGSPDGSGRERRRGLGSRGRSSSHRSLRDGEGGGGGLRRENSRRRKDSSRSSHMDGAVVDGAGLDGKARPYKAPEAEPTPQDAQKGQAPFPVYNGNVSYPGYDSVTEDVGPASSASVPNNREGSSRHSLADPVAEGASSADVHSHGHRIHAHIQHQTALYAQSHPEGQGGTAIGEDMGSVLGAVAVEETEDVSEEAAWKRSALKKFHKVMVKGEGLRVVKHNRSGGSQLRIIRYDPEMKALVWNSQRLMRSAGNANIPITGIKRVGREGNTVSVTAAGRGTIGFEPQRIRDAKILEEALTALVDKEERSQMWRG